MDEIINWSKFVYYVAHKFQGAGFRCGLEFEDLVQVGFEGYIRALKKVNPNVTESERTAYIRTRIFGTVIDALRSNSKYTRHQFDDARKLGALDCLPQEVSLEEFSSYFESDVLTKIIVWDLITQSLTPFEKHLVQLFFVRGCTMLEIAESFDYTESRISQLLSVAVRKMRELGQIRISHKPPTLKRFH